MYIRKRSNILKNGQIQNSFSLVETRRFDGIPKSKTLLNLGKRFSIKPVDWNALTDEVEFRLHHPENRVFEKHDYEYEIQDIIKRLNQSGYDINAPRDDRLSIIPKRMRMSDCRSVGGERLAIKALKMLGFDALLRDLGWSVRECKIAMVLVVGRMLCPGSELKTFSWMNKHSSILELLDTESKPFSLTSLYRVGDSLYDHKKVIIDSFFTKAMDLFSFKPEVLFYDLTNTYYTGRIKDSVILRYGRSKEKRKDCPLVSLALTLDASGFPIHTKVYPGHISEPQTLEKVIDGLNLSDPIVVMDAGISTEKNLDFLKNRGLHWITLMRGRKQAVPDRKADCRMELKDGGLLRLWSLEVKEEERLVYVHSSNRQETNDSILALKRTGYEEELIALDRGLSLPRRLKDYDRVLRKVGRLEQKYHLVSGHYKVVITKKEDSTDAESVVFTKLPQHDRHTQASGGTILRSSQTHWSLERLVGFYRQLNDIEQTFRSLKSELGLRPLYHRKDHRIEAHLFISILAYYGVHLIRKKLNSRGFYQSWHTLRSELKGWQRVSVSLYKTKKEKEVYRLDTDQEELPSQIAEIMGLPRENNIKKC